jgi:imidazolonepropionase-like amidohydrolase
MAGVCDQLRRGNLLIVGRMKEAIDSVVIPGPRVYPSGAFISQTFGHGDFAPPYARPKVLSGQLSYFENIGAFMAADGIP